MSVNDMLRQYRPAQLSTGKDWYVSYYAYNPELEKLVRKRIKINSIKKISERRKYANEMIIRINQQLSTGWNPFINNSDKRQYKRLSEVVEHFYKYLDKRYEDNSMRFRSYDDLKCRCKSFTEFVYKNYSDVYIYKVNKDVASRYLEYVYIDTKVRARTRNNQLDFLRYFGNFLVEHSYLEINFIVGLQRIKEGEKLRMVMNRDILKKVLNYFETRNMYYLLACKLLLYTFIRPNELSHLKIKDISYSRSTITIDANISKNGKTGTVTIPDVVTNLLLDLEIHNFPTDFYLFSTDFKPGAKYISAALFSKTWRKMRDELKLDSEIKFYSLKDTGITQMLSDIGDSVAVRDQARHHSIAVTDRYTPHNNKTANQKIKKYK